MTTEAAAAFSDVLDMWVRVAVADGRVTGVQLMRDGPQDAGADGGPAATVAARVVAVIAGARDDLRDVPVAWDALTSFQRAVLDALRDVPPGETTTYAALATAAGRPGAARAVGNAVAANPFIVLVPCHRVLPGTGRPGRYSGPGGTATKRALLEAEGAPLARGGTRSRVEPRLTAFPGETPPGPPKRI